MRRPKQPLRRFQSPKVRPAYLPARRERLQARKVALRRAARAFLKDNDIVCVPVADNRMSKLGNKLAAIRQEGKKRFKDGEPDNVTPIREVAEG